MEQSMRFDRKSGLVRQLNAFDVFLVNTFGYALGIAITINPAFIGGFAPSANIYLVLFFGLVAAIFNGVTYGLFSAVMPKTGGDYVYITRVLTPLIGFVANCGFTLAQLFGFALNCMWAFSQALAPSLTTFGMVAGLPGFVKAGTAVSNEATSFGLAIILMTVVLGVSLLGLRVTRWIFMVAFFVALAGPVIQAYALYSTTHDQFVLVFNDFMRGSGLSTLDYATVLELGKQRGLESHQSQVFLESIRALPLGFLMFLGFTYSAYMGSEVREASRSQFIGIMGALFLGSCFFFLVLGRYYYVVGNDFNAALSAESVSSRMPAGTSMTFFAGILVTSVPINALMSIGNFLWFLLVPLVILQVCCRNIHVWAVDYLLPESVARTNRFGAPVRAAAIAWVLGVLLLTVSFVRHNYAPVGAVALASVCILLSGLAAVRYPTSRWFRQARSSAAVFRFFGIGTIVAFSWILWAAMKYPEISGSSGFTAALLWVIGVYGSAAAFFWWRRRALKRQLAKEGMSIDDIWGDFPED